MKKAAKAAGLSNTYHCHGQGPCALMIPCVDKVPASSTGIINAIPAGTKSVASIGVLRSFDSVYVLTSGTGGPLDTTRTVTLLVFKTAFQQAQFGLGAALAFILTLVILLFTLIQFRVLGRRVNYG